jgi:hypothetical protein
MKLKLPLILSLVLFILTKPVYADIPIKEFSDAQCSLDEKMIVCDNGFRWNGNNKTNECQNYRLNPAYRQLTVETKYDRQVSSDHGIEKYCLRNGSFIELFGYHVLNSGRLLLITIIIELPLFWLFRFRGKKCALAIILMNALSVPILYLLSLALPYRNLYILLVLETGVVIFESYLFTRFNREFTLRNIFIFTLIINAVSAIFGSSVNSLF